MTKLGTLPLAFFIFCAHCIVLSKGLTTTPKADYPHLPEAMPRTGTNHDPNLKMLCAENGVYPVQCGLCSCCYMNKSTTVKCTGSDVTNVSDIGIPLNATDIEFVGTYIRDLHSESSGLGYAISPFYRYTKLIHLSFIMNVHLQNISIGAFNFHPDSTSDLGALTILGSPLLTELPKGALGYFHNLRVLKIVDCGLTRPPDWRHFFPGSIDKPLNLIDLKGNNIQQLDKTSFHSFFHAVEKISLEQNMLTRIGDESFSGMTIHELTLRGNNKLHTIEDKAFKDVIHLNKLDLSDTRISHLPTTGLDTLEHLVLKRVRSLKVFPPVWDIPSVTVAELTYPQHCCAFAHPDKKDPEGWEAFLQQFREMCGQSPDPEFAKLVADESENQVISDPSKSPRFSILKPTTTHTTTPTRHSTLPLDQSHYEDIYYDVRGRQVPTIDPTATHRYNSGCGAGYVVGIERHVTCTPEPDAFNPCEDLMGWWQLRGVVWIVVTCAIFGNLLVVTVICLSKHKITVHSFLMCNLAFADLLLGVYLLLLATTDVATIGRYFTIAIPWQYEGGCQVAGFLAIFATNLSVFTLTVITLERWYAIRHAINLSKRLKLRQTFLILLSVWIYSILMACLPLIGVSDHSMTSICLPMRAESIGDQLYLVLMLLANASAFGVICYCYIDMYRQVRGGGGGRSSGRHESGSSSTAGPSDAAIAKKMAVLVVTDFICLFPIALFGLTAALGLPLITVSQSKILLVLFFPVNSCCNPFLYVILTQQFRQDLVAVLSRCCGLCEKRAARYRYSFSSNQLSTNNSRNNNQSSSSHRNNSKNGSGSKTRKKKAGSGSKSGSGGKQRSSPAHAHYMPVGNNGDMTTDTSLSAATKSRASVPVIVLDADVNNGACVDQGIEDIRSCTTAETELSGSREGYHVINTSDQSI